MLTAISKNNLDEVKKLVKKVDVNNTDKNKWSNKNPPLFYAIFNIVTVTNDKILDIIKAIVEEGKGNINLENNMTDSTRYPDNQTPLMYLLQKKYYYKTDVGISDKMDMIMKRYVEIAKYLIEKGADLTKSYNPRMGGRGGDRNFTALMYACTDPYNHRDLIPLILKKYNKNINERNMNGNTALMIACINLNVVRGTPGPGEPTNIGEQYKKYNLEAIKALIDNGADVNKGNIDEFVEGHNIEGFTNPLMSLVMGQGANCHIYRDVVKLLISRGAKLDIEIKPHVYNLTEHVNKCDPDILRTVKPAPAAKSLTTPSTVNQTAASTVNSRPPAKAITGGRFTKKNRKNRKKLKNKSRRR